MARSVIISTPIPTLEELGKRLGLSKRRQRSLLRLMGRDVKTGGPVVKRSRNASGTAKAKTTVSGSTK